MYLGGPTRLLPHDTTTTSRGYNMRTVPTLVCLTLVLAGCGGTPAGEATDADPAATSTPSAASPSPTPTTSEPDLSTIESVTPTPTPEEESGPAAFGKTFTYEDGLAVTIGAPKKFSPSDSSFGGEGKGTSMQFQVTLKNATGATFDPSMASASVSSGEAEAEEIFDSAKKVGGAPETKVLNGKTVKFNVGFHVLNPKDITMEFTPSFEHDAAIFTNNP
jgi:hypothetical protein